MTARGAIGVRGTPRAPVDAPLPDGVVEVPAGILEAWRNNPVSPFRPVVFGRLVPAAFFAWLGYQQLLRLAVDVRALPRPVTAVALHDDAWRAEAEQPDADLERARRLPLRPTDSRGVHGADLSD